jgi:hypothetical protein
MPRTEYLLYNFIFKIKLQCIYGVFQKFTNIFFLKIKLPSSGIVHNVAKRVEKKRNYLSLRLLRYTNKIPNILTHFVCKVSNLNASCDNIHYIARELLSIIKT